ncbi:MAG: ABC transporter permease [Caulobacteraceae bacterium]|nr:ABC transporter permease [Caulobacteraceae bacterium]
MTALGLVAALIRRAPFTWAFHALGLAVAVAVLGSVLLLQRAAEDRLTRDLAGVDLVVGAKGSPLQIVTSTLFQVDAPTGNIPLSVQASLAGDPLVEAAVPVSLGDSVAGARIVGTTTEYLGLYGAEVVEGSVWDDPMQAVLGHEAARRLSLSIGDSFAGEHGLSGGEAHADQPYRVVGILGPTGAVIDRLVLTDLSSVWALHGHDDEAVGGADDHDHAHDHAAATGEEGVDAVGEITAVLVRYRSPLAAVVLPRRIAGTPDLQPAAPPEEARRLAALVGAGSQAIAGLGVALLVLSGVGFLIALIAAVYARRREIALLLALGASPARMMSLSLMEGGLLGLAGGVIGAFGARAVAETVAATGPGGHALPLPVPGLAELLLVIVAVALGLIGSILPGWIAARTSVVRTLVGG